MRCRLRHSRRSSYQRQLVRVRRVTAVLLWKQSRSTLASDSRVQVTNERSYTAGSNFGRPDRPLSVSHRGGFDVVAVEHPLTFPERRYTSITGREIAPHPRRAAPSLRSCFARILRALVIQHRRRCTRRQCALEKFASAGFSAIVRETSVLVVVVIVVEKEGKEEGSKEAGR